MTNPTNNPADILRAELAALKWPDLKRKASQEYGIKLLAEYNADDIITLIVGKATGATNYVTDKQDLSEKDSRAGWSRIRVMKNSNEQGTHCMVCHNGYQIAIPYNVEVNIPTVTAEYIASKQTPMPVEAGDGVGVRIEYAPRWVVAFMEKNYGPEGETGYIPKSERHKYWTEIRERKLNEKREFFRRFQFWPTDKKLKQYFEAGLFRKEEVRA